MSIPRFTRSPDPMLYFVLADFGPLGRAWVERSVGDMDRNTTIRDIREGQIENVVRVLEVSLEGPICSDVTEDILRAAGPWFDDPAPLSPSERLAACRDHARELRNA